MSEIIATHRYIRAIYQHTSPVQPGSSLTGEADKQVWRAGYKYPLSSDCIVAGGEYRVNLAFSLSPMADQVPVACEQCLLFQSEGCTGVLDQTLRYATLDFTGEHLRFFLSGNWPGPDRPLCMELPLYGNDAGQPVWENFN